MMCPVGCGKRFHGHRLQNGDKAPASPATAFTSTERGGPAPTHLDRVNIAPTKPPAGLRQRGMAAARWGVPIPAQTEGFSRAFFLKRPSHSPDGSVGQRKVGSNLVSNFDRRTDPDDGEQSRGHLKKDDGM